MATINERSSSDRNQSVQVRRTGELVTDSRSKGHVLSGFIAETCPSVGGDVFYAFEAQHVVPDIVVLGKPIGNGYPLAPSAAARSRVPPASRYWRQRLRTDGPLHNVLKIRSPMPFNERDADRLLETLDDVLGLR